MTLLGGGLVTTGPVWVLLACGLRAALSVAAKCIPSLLFPSALLAQQSPTLPLAKKHPVFIIVSVCLVSAPCV